MEDSQEKDYSFLFPNLYDALVYERKFKSEYLERQIYERSLKSETSIENKSDLSKLSTLSEPSIVKFIDNQSEHLSKLTLLTVSSSSDSGSGGGGGGGSSSSSSSSSTCSTILPSSLPLPSSSSSLLGGDYREKCDVKLPW